MARELLCKWSWLAIVVKKHGSLVDPLCGNDTSVVRMPPALRESTPPMPPKGSGSKMTDVEIKMWVHPTDPTLSKKADVRSKARFEQLYQHIPNHQDNLLVYTHSGKEFKCEWRGADIQVRAISSETTASSELVGLSFETPLEWCIAIRYYETRIWSRQISPKGDLMYNGLSLKAWQQHHDLVSLR